MVAHTGKTLHTGTFKPVNMPEGVRVEEDSKGTPLALQEKRRQAVVAIESTWRIDDEWWRPAPLSRTYFEVMLASGQHLILFKNLIDSSWYRQTY